MSAIPVIAIHGGAGTILRSAMNAEAEARYHAALAGVLHAGERILAGGGRALDAVTEAVRLLEDCPLFNAGHGAVFTAAGTHELDASIMDGATLEAGAISCVTHLKNPVLAARRVLEVSEHVMFTAAGAEAFALEQGLEFVEPLYFHTDARYQQWLKARGTSRTLLDHDAASQATDEDDPLDPTKKFGTVGARRHEQAGRPGRRCALDRRGLLCERCDLRGLDDRNRRDVHPHARGV
jgi:beta-aspartyl-peptidase (threonine type)